MDGYKEEGSSSQDRQPIPIVHEVGEGSSQAEEVFRMKLVNDVTLFKHLMENPRFMEFLQSPLIAQQVQDHPPLSQHVEAQFQAHVSVPENVKEVVTRLHVDAKSDGKDPNAFVDALVDDLGGNASLSQGGALGSMSTHASGNAHVSATGISASKSNVGSSSKKRKGAQGPLASAFSLQAREQADRALRRFFYAEDIPEWKVRSPLFLEMVKAIGQVGPSYVPPTYNALRTTELNDELTHEVMDLNQQLKSLKVETEVSSKQLEGLIKEKEADSLAIEMDIDSSDTEESKMLHLKKSMEKRLLDSKVERESILAAPESRRICMESSNLSKNNELHLQDLKVVRQKIEEITAKLQQRDKQNELLEQKLAKSMKGPSRSSYVGRITELIKNSKKQDADILRILDETRDLQRDSNANQGRLKRTYALVDELVFRDAKKDATSRQAYRLLTSIHENFASCYDAVFSVDKLHREIAELQVSLEAMEKRPVDLKRAEVDFEAFISENLCLDKAVEANIKNDSGLK
ncbi:hypothetical protein L7F22_058612 [Adiantum nelumboides]|nr:hypothetical protein [Adiantum nelumboides]